VILHVAGTLLVLEKLGVFGELNSDSIVKTVKIQLDKVCVSSSMSDGGKVDIDRPYWGGLGFNNDDIHFSTLMSYARERKQSSRVANYSKIAEGLFELMSKDPSLFLRRICQTNHSDNLYFEDPILHEIKVDAFLDKLMNLKPDDQRTIGVALKERYSSEHFFVSLQSEYAWLKNLKDDALKVAPSLGWDGFRLNKFVEWYVDPALIKWDDWFKRVQATNTQMTDASVHA
jgi:hypothetical protein